MEQHLKPLGYNVDKSFKTWTSQTTYSMKRIKDLTQACVEVFWRIYSAISGVNQFVKREAYASFKFPRGIRARRDAVKGVIGPLIKLIEKEVYSLPWFIKHVAVKDRPAYIHERLNKPGFVYSATDYKSFESLFVPQIMKICEFKLYRHMLKNQSPEILDEFEKMCTGTNKINVLGKGRRAKMRIKIAGCRMSGEMTTSLGNGFTNLMLATWVAKLVGCTIDNGQFNGVIEGDDGLFSTSRDCMSADVFARLGFKIKIDKFQNLNEAAFCKFVYDVDSLNNITEPSEQVVKFGWTDSQAMCGSDKTLIELLRAKAMSLICEFPSCPIVSALARYGERVTRGSKFRLNEKNWKVYDFSNLKWSEPISPSSRALVEKLYGVTVARQLSIESYLDSLNEICPLDSPLILDLMKSEWFKAGLYVVNTSLRIKL